MGNSVVTAGGGGWVEVEEGIRRINGNGKIQLKENSTGFSTYFH